MTFEGKFRGTDEKIKEKLKKAAATIVLELESEELAPNFGLGR